MRDHRTETQLTVRGRDREPLHVVLVSTLLHGDDTGSGDTILTNVVDVSERYRYERQLAFLAEHDPLTGLANRRRFDTELERLCKSGADPQEVATTIQQQASSIGTGL